jgi:hypothetical protein
MEAAAGTPEAHLPAIRRLIRLLDKERSAYTVLETYEGEFRQFRTMQAANRVNVSEANARKASAAIEEAFQAWRDSLGVGI